MRLVALLQRSQGEVRMLPDHGFNLCRWGRPADCILNLKALLCVLLCGGWSEAVAQAPLPQAPIDSGRVVRFTTLGGDRLPMEPMPRAGR